MIPDHDVRWAMHDLRGVTPSFIDIFRRHEITAIVLAESNEEAAEMLKDETCVAVEQSGSQVLIVEFQSRKGVGNE